jgi:hypothetical protein
MSCLIALIVCWISTLSNYGQLMLLLYLSSWVLRLIARVQCAAVMVYFRPGPW